MFSALQRAALIILRAISAVLYSNVTNMTSFAICFALQVFWRAYTQRLGGGLLWIYTTTTFTA